MEIIKMTAKSGKTKYTGIKFENGTIKVQSRTKAIDIIKFIDLDTNFELVNASHHSRLSANGKDLGRISKKDYKTLLTLINHETSTTSIQTVHQQSQTSNSNSQGEACSGESVTCDLLPDSHNERFSNAQGSRLERGVLTNSDFGLVRCETQEHQALCERATELSKELFSTLRAKNTAEIEDDYELVLVLVAKIAELKREEAALIVLIAELKEDII
jgi:hypothetical protein